MFRTNFKLPSTQARILTANLLGGSLIYCAFVTSNSELPKLPRQLVDGMFLWALAVPAVLHVACTAQQRSDLLWRMTLVALAGWSFVLGVCAFQSQALAVLLVVLVDVVMLAADFRQHYAAMAASALVDAQAVEEFERRGKLPPGLSSMSRTAAFCDALVSFHTHGLEPDDIPACLGGDCVSRVGRLFSTILCVSVVTWYFYYPHLLPDTCFVADPYYAQIRASCWIVLNPAAFIPLWLVASFVFSWPILGKVYALRWHADAANAQRQTSNQ